ncbi:glycosyl hydrolase [Paucibacter sp. KCTC 42545]|nr:glycosyl hydrolase [Paucibacter sp. KCTC 42545]
MAVAFAAALPGQASEPAPTPVQLRPATRSAHAQQAPMLAAAWAGARAVAVGAHGTVLLSDDRGASWRQASVVPTQLTLTGLSFANEREGWAVGHGGVVLHTQDGGERWQLQRSELSQDRPLFAVHFFDRERGVAVGLWSLVLVTRDGGRHWQTQELAPPPGSQRADLNLFGLFAGPGGALYAAAEKGYVLHSADGGQSWDYLSTGYRGSFWSGLAMPDGVLLVGGLRGALYRSGDNGRSWNRIQHESKAAITAWAQTGERSCLAVGQDGLQLLSTDNGASYQAAPRQDRARLAAVLANANKPALLFSGQGPLTSQP